MLFIFYTSLVSLFILNTQEVSPFRFHDHCYNFGKSQNFSLFGSKKKGSRYAEDEPDTSVSEEVLDRLHNDCKAKLKSIENYVRGELSKIYDHRAVPSLIDHVYIVTSNGKRQLKHLASIVTRGNFELVVNPFSQNDLNDIYSSLSTNLTGYQVKLLDSSVSVSLGELGSNIKKLSQDIVKRLQNEGLEQIRMARQNTMKNLKNLESGLSQDMLFSQKAEVEGHIKQSTANVEKMCRDKIASFK